MPVAAGVLPQDETKKSSSKIRIFEKQPQVSVTDVETVKKNMFQSFRLFTLNTKPNGWVVKRNRDDLK